MITAPQLLVSVAEVKEVRLMGAVLLKAAARHRGADAGVVPEPNCFYPGYRSGTTGP